MIDTTDNEIRRIFATSVNTTLQAIVIGKTKTYFIGDDLYIEIEAVNNIHFKYVRKDVLQSIVNGIYSTAVAYECAKTYQKYLLKKFFK